MLMDIAHMSGGNGKRALLKDLFYLKFCEKGVQNYLMNGHGREAERILGPLRERIADLEDRLSKTI